MHVKENIQKSRRNPNANLSEAKAPLTRHTASGPRSHPGSSPAAGLRAGRAPTHPWRLQAERGRPGEPRSGRLGSGRPRSRCAPKRSMARPRRRRPSARAPAPRPADSLGRRGWRALRLRGVGWGGVRGTLLRARGGLDGWRALPDPVPTQLRCDGTCRRPRGQKGEFLGVRKVFRPSGRGAPGARSSNPTSALGRALRPWPGTWTALGLGFRDRRLPGMTVPSWRQD